MSIFSQLYSFFLLEMHFGVAGELIVVWHCCISVTICVQCCGRNFSDNRGQFVMQWIDVFHPKVRVCKVSTINGFPHAISLLYMCRVQ
jgi:hypothetical protein